MMRKECAMQPFRKILFPVDLSSVAPTIAPYVSEMQAKFNGEVHVLFVARLFEYFTSIYVPHPSIKNFEDEIVKGAQKKLKEFTTAFFKDRPFKARVVTGDPAEEILKYVQSEGMDLIIIGTHGRKGLERVIFGSVAERVVTKSPVPVLTINPYRKPA
jgi:nucleotide-binding universal stress UspA family protein